MHPPLDPRAARIKHDWAAGLNHRGDADREPAAAALGQASIADDVAVDHEGRSARDIEVIAVGEVEVRGDGVSAGRGGGDAARAEREKVPAQLVAGAVKRDPV